MFRRRITSEGLSHHSYVLADGGEAVVIDPRRDVDVYLHLADEQGFRIRWVLETHRNEDYVVGSTALAAATGAGILHGAGLPFGYGEPVREGDTIGVGSLRFHALETPGHTDESLTWAMSDTDAADEPVFAFTGDALFVGDVGRTDLYGPEEEERLARTLHRSLCEKILPLGDWVVLQPAHGGGSVCGGAISERDLSTLGFERRHNPSLLADGAAFVERRLAQRQVRPPYFRRMEHWNLEGPPIELAPPRLVPLALDRFEGLREEGVRVIDTRMPQAFGGAHVPGSINVWLGGLTAYLSWVAAPDEPIVLVLPERADVEAVARTLFRIGYDRVEGHLQGGFEAWQNAGRPVESTATVDVASLPRLLEREEAVVLDVRKPDEWEGGSLPGARRIFVGDLPRHLGELPRDRLVISMCSVGHRGGIGASLLQAAGFERVANFLGGLTAWKAAGHPVDGRG